jgi:integrase
MSTKLSGTRAAARTVTLRRTNLSAALGFAVELGYLQENPLGTVKWVAPKAARVIDRRVVANPDQARGLLAAVRLVKRSGPRLVAFFAVLYYAGLRPEEAANLRKVNLQIPTEGRGWLVIESSAPEEDRHWSDSNVRREERELKHRARDDTRRCPCPPILTEILHRHIKEFGVASDGRLFRGEKGELLSGQTYRRVWSRARERALTEEQQASPLAGRPYDLRHAAVSTWLNGGIEPPRVAEWAGHSVGVLMKIYAKCLDGREEAALDRLEKALGE